MRRWCMVMIAGPLAACGPVAEPTDSGAWLVDVGLADALIGDDRPLPILQGTRFTSDVIAYRDASGEYVELPDELRECVHAIGIGALADVPNSVDDELVVAGLGPGAIGVSAPREACPSYEGPMQDVERDELAIVGVAASETVGDWVPGLESLAQAYGSPGPGSFPSDFAAPLARPRIVPDGYVFLEPLLLRDDVQVRHASAQVELELASEGDALRFPTEDGYLPALSGAVPADTPLAPRLVTESGVVVLPEPLTVELDAVASLELVPVYDRDQSGQREWGPPLGVAALARDAEGNRILGTSIHWTLERGHLAMHYLDDRAVTPDVLVLGDVCRETPPIATRRSATIEARLGDRVEQIELEWVALPDDVVDLDHPRCETSGCACSAGGDASRPALGLLALLVLAGVRRRPRATAPARAKVPTAPARVMQL